MERPKIEVVSTEKPKVSVVANNAQNPKVEIQPRVNFHLIQPKQNANTPEPKKQKVKGIVKKKNNKIKQ